MIAFFEVISTSAPHIYCSALPLSPQASVVQKLYKQYAHPLVRVVQGLPISWRPIVATLYINVWNTIWSPCSRFIIIHHESTKILDGVTLKKLSTLDTLPPSCFCFSPDSHFLVELGNDKLINWDLQTGCQVGTADLGLEAHRRLNPHCFEEEYPLGVASFTYSTDGKLLAVDYNDIGCSFIITYNLLSMTHAGPYYSPTEIMDPIWTHGECLRFATRKPGYITIWEVGFTLIGSPVEAGSLQLPTEIDGEEINHEDFLFLPIVSRIAFSFQDGVVIWDAQVAKFLLKSGPLSTPGVTYTGYQAYIQAKSFSSSGHFFACIAMDNYVRVYKELPTGYILHQQFTVFTDCKLCISPDGESIVAHSLTRAHLWYTRDQITSISNASTQGNPEYSCFLEFSPNGIFAAFAWEKKDTVTVLNLQSSDPPLTINVGMEVKGLAVTESVIITASHEEVAVWNILRGNHSLNIEGKIANGIHIRLPMFSWSIRCISASHDLSHILVVADFATGSNLWVLNSLTEKYIGGTTTTELLSFAKFTLDGCEIQAQEYFSRDKMVGWKIVKDNKSGSVKLESLGEIPFTPKLPSWESSLGYEVMQDGWVLSPTQERLLWLPHQWRSARGGNERWCSQFLGLVHCELSEAIILEFLK